MELTTQQYVQITTSGQEYAIQNKSTSKNSTILVVKSATQPTFNDVTNSNAFEVEIGQGLTSANLPSPIWDAPLNKPVKFAIQTWTA